jgi:hypothetical protein
LAVRPEPLPETTTVDIPLGSGVTVRTTVSVLFTSRNRRPTGNSKMHGTITQPGMYRREYVIALGLVATTVNLPAASDGERSVRIAACASSGGRPTVNCSLSARAIPAS